MPENISEKELDKLKQEIAEDNEKRNEILNSLMEENEKYSKNIEVINIHNHFGGTQYYGNSGPSGILGTIGKIGKTIISNPELASIATFGAMYIGSKTVRKAINHQFESTLRIGDSKKTKVQKDDIKLLESKIASKNANVYTEKSVFSNDGFTVQANMDDFENIIFFIHSASDKSVIENYMKKKEVCEITFKNLPKDDSFVKLLKDLVKCKFHKLIFKEKDKDYNLYVSGDLQKDYRITFEKGEQ